MGIYHMKSAKHAPQLRFEWHEDTKRLFFVRVGAIPEIGEILAENVPHKDAAQYLVMIWLRGWKEASTRTIGNGA